MAALSRIRLVAWTMVAVAALGATGLYVYANTRPTTTAVATGPNLGAGDYQLVQAGGEPWTHDTLVGQPTAVFFGFTHCPEVCPTTLAEMTTWFEQLGDEAADLDAYFVSVDPERDTPEVIADYVGWTERVVGVTGTPEEVDKAARSFAVFYKKVPLEGGEYNVDHTASVFLLDRNGEFQGTIAYRESTETAVAKLRRLIEG